MWVSIVKLYLIQSQCYPINFNILTVSVLDVSYICTHQILCHCKFIRIKNPTVTVNSYKVLNHQKPIIIIEKCLWINNAKAYVDSIKYFINSFAYERNSIFDPRCNKKRMKGDEWNTFIYYFANYLCIFICY